LRVKKGEAPKKKKKFPQGWKWKGSSVKGRGEHSKSICLSRAKGVSLHGEQHYNQKGSRKRLREGVKKEKK